MKRKLIGLLTAAMMCICCLGSVVPAAQWENGRSPSQPYAGVPELDLNTTMGYIMLYPREKMPAEHFCDVLEIYLPREDIVAGSGSATLYDGSTEMAKIDFSDSKQVEIRRLTEEEMQGLMWGGGTCVVMHLPVSLDFNGNYHVLMDEGCFTAANGAVVNLPINNDTAWVPVLKGDFGVSTLYYSDASAGSENNEEENSDSSETIEYKLKPNTGDNITFDLIMKGDAVSAVIFSENGSVSFPRTEYTMSATISGKVIKNDVNWGIVFLNSAGDILDVLRMKDVAEGAEIDITAQTEPPVPETEEEQQMVMPQQETTSAADAIAAVQNAVQSTIAAQPQGETAAGDNQAAAQNTDAAAQQNPADAATADAATQTTETAAAPAAPATDAQAAQNGGLADGITAGIPSTTAPAADAAAAPAAPATDATAAPAAPAADTAAAPAAQATIPAADQAAAAAPAADGTQTAQVSDAVAAAVAQTAPAADAAAQAAPATDAAATAAPAADTAAAGTQQAADTTAAAAAPANDGVTPELKEFMDAYEACENSYYDILSTYDQDKASADEKLRFAEVMKQHLSYIQKAAEYEESYNNGTMSSEDQVYYLTVMGRINQRTAIAVAENDS